jgi:predicted DNA-binding transcriptional regulator YafY
MKEKAFEVEVEFSGWSAQFVSERIWSPDQKIVKKGRGKVRVTFSASSEPEVIGRILFFGEEAKVLKPDWLVNEMAKKVKIMHDFYRKRG